MERSVIVTGGSRGIGAAIALAAADKGFQVCVNYLGAEDAAKEVVWQIEENGGKAIAVRADMAKEPDILRMFAAVDDQLAPLGALVNNAGITGLLDRVENYTEERLNRIFTTNITGPFICAREAIKRMSTHRGGKGGSIVNISSVASRLGSPNEYVDYAASKGAIDTMTLGLSKELAEEGIRVNAVRPGVVYTDIHTSSGEPDRVNRVKEMVPMKRGGEPREIADAAVWLLTDEASYITGALLDVSGGR